VNAIATYKPDGADVVAAVHTKEQNLALDPLSLAKRWQIGLDTAKATLKVTTQRGIQTAIAPLHWRYRTNIAQLRYNRWNSIFYSDTMIAGQRLLGMNKDYQVFVNDLEFVRGY
jgi:hypothetical protein